MSTLVIKNLASNKDSTLVTIGVRAALVKFLSLSESAADDLLRNLPANIGPLNSDKDAQALYQTLRNLGVEVVLTTADKGMDNLSQSLPSEANDSLQSLLDLLDNELSIQMPTGTSKNEKVLTPKESIETFNESAPLSTMFKSAGASFGSKDSNSEINLLSEELDTYTQGTPSLQTPIETLPTINPPKEDSIGVALEEIGLDFDLDERAPVLSSVNQPTSMDKSQTRKPPDLEIPPELKELDSQLLDLSKLLDGALGKPTQATEVTEISDIASISPTPKETKTAEDPLDMLLSFDGSEPDIPAEQQETTSKQPDQQISPTLTMEADESEKDDTPSIVASISNLPISDAKKTEKVSEFPKDKEATKMHETSTKEVTPSNQTPVDPGPILMPVGTMESIAHNPEAIFHGHSQWISKLMTPEVATKAFGGLVIGLTGLAFLLYFAIQPTVQTHTTQVPQLLKEQKQILEKPVAEKPKEDFKDYKADRDIDKIHVSAEVSYKNNQLHSFSMTLTEAESPPLSKEDIVKGRKRSVWLKSIDLALPPNEIKSISNISGDLESASFNTPARAYLTDGSSHNRMVVNVSISLKKVEANQIILNWEILGGNPNKLAKVNSAERQSPTTFDLKYQGSLELQSVISELAKPEPAPPTEIRIKEAPKATNANAPSKANSTKGSAKNKG